MWIERVHLPCLAASYGLALVLELIQLFRPAGLLRWLAVLAALAGLVAHTLFLVGHHVALASQAGALLFPAWGLAVFYLIGSIHHRRLAWGVFVLPVLLALTVLSGAFTWPAETASGEGAGFWPLLHIALFAAAAIGISVGFVASLMYLVQAHRLKAKVLPSQGLRLLSLERLERMNRRAITWTFPLLTLGLVISMALMLQEGGRLQGWADPRILSTVALWLVFAIVLYLRYGLRLRGRRVALLTIVAFGLLLVTLVTSHNHKLGGGP